MGGILSRGFCDGGILSEGFLSRAIFSGGILSGGFYPVTLKISATSSYKLPRLTNFLIHFVVPIDKDKMEVIQDQAMEIISRMEEIVQVISSLFQCVKKENNMISDIKDLREEINDLISDLKDDI